MPLSSLALNPPVNLTSWEQALRSDSRWKLILRNFDRECDRSDINPVIWEQFLRDIESDWNVIAARPGYASPVKAIDNVIARNWQAFTPPGKAINESGGTMLYRYMRLDQFWQHNLTSVPISGQSAKLAQQIQSGNVTGADITGHIGPPNRPGWCTNDSNVSSSIDANDIRDQVGLKHIEGDWLLELAFPYSFLQDQNIELRAPTVIDSVAAGAENWIFSKRQGLGGPDWGLTVDMHNGGACAPGIAEAVHKQFNGVPQSGFPIQLRAVGEITTSAPSVDYGALLLNTAI